MPQNNRIKSYVIRAGRMSSKQRSSLDTLLPCFGLQTESVPWNFKQIFSRSAPTVIEIGFGMGQSLAEMAIQHPDENFIGIEVHPPGVGALLSLIAENKIENLRICMADAVSALETNVPDNSLARVQLFFPDPWPKKRHHKRRLVQPPFVDLINRKLQSSGIFHVATDWLPYAEHIAEIMAQDTRFQHLPGDNRRLSTKYERRGERLGHTVTDLVFKSKGA